MQGTYGGYSAAGALPRDVVVAASGHDGSSNQQAPHLRSVVYSASSNQEQRYALTGAYTHPTPAAVVQPMVSNVFCSRRF